MTLQPNPNSFIAPDMFAPVPPTQWFFDGLTPQLYNFLMIDPPWKFENWSETGDAKQPEYDLMEDDEICAMPVGDLAHGDCLVWLWATWPKLDVAMRALGAWGFEYKTGGAWDKKRWGNGRIWRSVCEPVLIGTKGAPRAKGGGIPNLFSESRREHSRKPECAYDMAEQMMPRARRADLFSRENRPGWTAWGNEKGKFDDCA